MNQKQKRLNRQETLSKVKRESLYATRVGTVKIWKGNTDIHELCKFLIEQKLIRQGYECIPEAEFNGGGRADILVIDNNGNGTCVEILASEKESRCALKENIYPFPIVQVKAKELIGNLYMQIEERMDTWEL